MNTNRKSSWKGQLTTDAGFCSLHCYSSLLPLCMCVHTSFWVSVETLFICLWACCVPSSWSLILPQSPQYRDSPSFLFFSLSSKTHLSIPAASAITSVKMLPKSIPTAFPAACWASPSGSPSCIQM